MSGMLEISRQGPVCLVRIRREEKLNALSSHLERELMVALESDEVAGSGCVVVAGGERAFSAGADLGELANPSPADVIAYYRTTGEMYERVAAHPRPTIAAISGWCLGGGLELALACDFRVASESATFGLPEVEIGIIPSSGGTLRITRMLGPAKARELVLLRTRFSSREALDLGVVTEVVEGDPVPRAIELGERLAALPALAVELAKATIDRVPESSREGALLIERLTYAALASTGEAAQATERFGGERSG